MGQKNATILIIEDDAALATGLHSVLIGADYVVRQAASAAEALAILDQTPADLVLMGLLLPDGDGLVLCSTLTARSATPVIVLVPRTSEVERALALKSGAIDCLSTPIDPDELLAQVNAAIYGRCTALISSP